MKRIIADNHIEKIRKSLREYISKFRLGKRVLIKDGSIGWFVEFLGSDLEGDLMVLDIEGKQKKIDIQEFKATLSDDIDIRCPVCNSSHVTDGFLKGYGDSALRFTANVTESMNVAPSFEDSVIKVHKCVECDYVMCFAEKECMYVG